MIIEKLDYEKDLLSEIERVCKKKILKPVGLI